MSSPLHDTVRDFILHNFLFTDDPATVAFGDSLLEKGIVDSTGMLEVILFLEERFGMKVQDEDMIPENFGSIDRLVAFIQNSHRAA